MTGSLTLPESRRRRYLQRIDARTELWQPPHHSGPESDASVHRRAASLLPRANPGKPILLTLLERSGRSRRILERPPVQEHWQKQQRNDKAVDQAEHEQQSEPRIGRHL